MGFAEHRSCPLRSVCPLDRSPAGAKISLGLLCLFEQKLWPLHFVVFSRAPVFSLVPLNRTPPRTPLPHLSLCAVVISDQPKHIHFYIFIYKMGEKNDPGNFYGTLITGWFFLFFIFIFSKPDATEQVLQFITEICLCQLVLSSYKCWNCPVCQQSVSLAPLLKSLTPSKPLQLARNNTYCFIPVKCCKYFTLCRWSEDSREEMPELGEQLHTHTRSNWWKAAIERRAS